MARDANDNQGTWAERRGASIVLRVVIFLIPVILSVLGTAIISQALPAPENRAVLVSYWILLSIAATSILYMTDKLARQLLPLQALLGLSLIFPDRAPSRFKAAMRSAGVRQLERRIAEVKKNGLGDSETEATETLVELIGALAHHDRLTRGHAERVRAYSRMIGEEMGFDEDAINKLTWAGLMHDVGKIFVPREILNKPGSLTPEEFEIIKTHPGAGADLVEPLEDWLGDWVRAVGEHHERWDGNGYPNGLAGEEIASGARIVAVADAFDVLTSARSYKSPQSAAAARAEIQRCAGSHFDATVVRAFLNISVGRFRLVMGPLSWLAQNPIAGVPVAPAVGAVASGFATAVGLLVGGLFIPPSVEQPPAEVIAAPAFRDAPVFRDPPTTLPPTSTTSSTSTTSTSTTSTTVPSSTVTTVAPFIDVFESASPDADGTPIVAVDDRLVGREGQPATLDPLANDPSGLTVTSVSRPGVGSVEVQSDGSIRFDPPRHWWGTTAFSYRATHTNGQIVTAEVTVDFEAVPDPPFTEPDIVVRAEDSAPVNIDVTANDGDPDLEPIRVTGISRVPSSSPAIGSVAITSSGLVRFAPFADAFGTDQFIYFVSDPGGLTASNVLTVTLTPVNDPPIARNDVGSMNEDTTKTFAVRSNDFDVDGGPLTTTSATSTNGTATTNGTTVTYRPAPDSFGTHRVRYSISDGRGGTASATLTINVLPVNDPPVARDDVGSMTEDDPAKTFFVLGNDTDVDGGPLSITNVSSAFGTAATNGSTVTYQPNPNGNGVHTVTYTITDGRGGTSTATLRVNVTPVNDPPVFTIGADDTVDEDSGPRTVPGWATSIGAGPIDEFTQSLSFNVSASNPGLFSVRPSLSATTGTLTYTPEPEASGTSTITVVLTDSAGASSPPQTATITVSEVNDPPTFTVGPAQTVQEDAGPQTVPGWATAIRPGPTNESGQTVAFQVAVDDPDLFSALPTVTPAGALTYTPADDAFGTATLTITLADSGGASSAPRTTTIDITPVNDPPVAVGESYLVDEGGTLTVAAPGLLDNDNDTDGDLLTVAPVPATPPTNGALTLAPDGGFTYTPNSGFAGRDSFVYLIRDPSGLTATATVEIRVSSLVTSQGWYLGTTGTSASTWDLVAAPLPPGSPEPDHDLDGDPGLTVKDSNQQLTETDPRKFQHWTLPAASPLVLDGPVTLDLWSTTDDFEPDEEIDYSAWLHDCAADGTDCQPITGTLDVHFDEWNAGASDWVLRTLQVGSADHTVATGRMLRLRLMFDHDDVWIAMSGDRPSKLNLSLSNRPPVAVDDTASTDGPFFVNVNVKANDTDPDLDLLSISSWTQPANGTVTPNGSGTLRYTPDLFFFGLDTFTYTITDERGGFDSATVRVNVNAIPVAVPDVYSVGPGPTVLDVTANDFDLDGQPVSIFSVSTGGVEGSVSCGATTCTYNPGGFRGVTTFWYFLRDPSGALSPWASVTITVS